MSMLANAMGSRCIRKSIAARSGDPAAPEGV
jgi:hypothetical protein